jgi:hypothetical protein
MRNMGTKVIAVAFRCDRELLQRDGLNHQPRNFRITFIIGLPNRQDPP